MKWVAEVLSPRPLKLVIEQQTLTNVTDQKDETGFYLYVYDDKGFNTHDYLQDTFDAAVEQAEEDFGVPLTAWKPA